MNNSSQTRQLIQHLPLYAQGCYSDHPGTQFKSTRKIRKLSSIEPSPIQEIMDSGVLDRLVQFLKIETFPKLQFEASYYCLTHITAVAHEHVATVIRYGAVPLLIELLKSECDDVKEVAVCTLAYISGDSTRCRNSVLRSDALTMLEPIFCRTKQYETYLVSGYMEQEFATKSINYEYEINMIIIQYLCIQPPISLIQNAICTLKNCCRGKPYPDWKYVELLIKTLSIMINSEDEQILRDTCWAFGYLSEHQQQFDVIIKSGCLYRLICLLEHKNADICHGALRRMGNIVTGTNKHSQTVINLGLINKLSKLIKHDRTAIKREVCWIISNVAAGSEQQIEAVIECNLFESLIYILKNENYENEIAKEAFYAISKFVYIQNE